MKAFTLIETLVAITVITLAILAPFGAVQQVVRATSLSRDQLVAGMLAQEGVEYVRFIRYTNWLQSDRNGGTTPYSPLRGLNGTAGPTCVSTGSTENWCTVDAKADPYDSTGRVTGVARCGGGLSSNCARLYLTGDGMYTQQSSGNAATPYKRFITLTQPAGNQGYVTVTVTVTWENRGTQTISVKEDLYDWL